MRSFNIFLVLFLLFTSINSFSQNILPSDVKHIEVVSEVQDTMALLNKEDVNKINKVFHERNYLDSLRVADSCLIVTHNEIKERMDSIVSTQTQTISNQGLIIGEYEDVILDNNKEIDSLKKKQKRDKGSKIAWQSISGTLAVVLLVILLI